jgi:mono/diheme cytochrome c family protein
MRQIDHGVMLSAAAALALMLAVTADAIEARAEETPDGQLYLKYCSACHGSEGKGDGVVSQLMRPKPTDLTKIAKQHDGDFPTLSVMQVIDGRKTVRAHGDPDMPVWGELLRSPVGGVVGAEPGTRSAVMRITEHLGSIQSK